ncbi:MAG TPA: hypothetical protein VHU44_13640 [Acidobacteriaceae bacterium]|jgi:hypothetical protein|nr:hypothetical protein [Acidobacteriaceae bacterium]
MKLALKLFLTALLAAPQLLLAQASDIPSAAPATGDQSQAQRGRTLIDQMIAALGGDPWLNRKTETDEAHGSSFFRGEPNPYIVEFRDIHRFAASGQPEAERVGFLTPRGMLVPGKKIDVVQIWKDGHGYEITYKGKTDLPKDQVEEFYRRRAHSIEEVVRSWINQPGVMIIAEGTTMVDRRSADKVTVLTANNDAVTFELDTSTHLPLRRTFQWRNQQFKDFDEDSEDYADYHTIQGLPTAMTITRYKNGDMVSQRFITKVTYNDPVDPSQFDPDILVKKK